jgi:WD40 repeat protein
MNPMKHPTAAALTVVVLIAFTACSRGDFSEPREVLSVSLDAITANAGNAQFLTVGPEGRYAYVREYGQAGQFLTSYDLDESKVHQRFEVRSQTAGHPDWHQYGCAAWSPDGKQVVFYDERRVLQAFQPASLLVFDPESGQILDLGEVLRQDESVGLFAPAWDAKNRLSFQMLQLTGEDRGISTIYRMDRNGKVSRMGRLNRPVKGLIPFSGESLLLFLGDPDKLTNFEFYYPAEGRRRQIIPVLTRSFDGKPQVFLGAPIELAQQDKTGFLYYSRTETFRPKDHEEPEAGDPQDMLIGYLLEIRDGSLYSDELDCGVRDLQAISEIQEARGTDISRLTDPDARQRLLHCRLSPNTTHIVCLEQAATADQDRRLAVYDIDSGSDKAVLLRFEPSDEDGPGPIFGQAPNPMNGYTDGLDWTGKRIYASDGSGRLTVWRLK